MFERYTEKARRAIFFARYHANEDGSDQITPCHLLLGLFREDRDLLAALPNGITFAAVNELVRALYPLPPPRDTPKVANRDLPLSHSCKRVLAYGAEAQARLGAAKISPAINLIGMMRERDRGVEHVFQSFGLTAEDVTRAAEAYARSETAPPPPAPSVQWAPQIAAPVSTPSLHVLASSTRYEGAALIVETSCRIRGAEIRMLQRWTPSEDGKTLTYAHEIVTPKKTDVHEAAFDL